MTDHDRASALDRMKDALLGTIGADYDPAALNAATPEQVDVASLLAGLGRELPKLARDIIVDGQTVRQSRWTQLAEVLDGAARLCAAQCVLDESERTEDRTTEGA